MATPFEVYVNTELPKRPSTSQDPLTLTAGQIPFSTGVGLELEFRDLNTITQPITDTLNSAIALEATARTDAIADVSARLAAAAIHTHRAADVVDFADTVVQQFVSGSNIALVVDPDTKKITISAVGSTRVATGNDTGGAVGEDNVYLVQISDGLGGFLGVPQPAESRLVLTSNAIGIPTWEPAQTSGGTVTSIDVRGGSTGLIFEGGPIDTEGVLRLDGVLSVKHGGTGVTSIAEILTTILPPQAGMTGAALFTDGADISWQLIPGNIYTPGIGLTANGNEFNSIVTKADGVAGRVPVTVGDGTLTNLFPGDKGFVLTSEGDGIPPSWQPVKGTVSNIRIQNSSNVGLRIIGGDPINATDPSDDPANPASQSATQITTTGTLSLGGVLSVMNGGTGASSSIEALEMLLPPQSESPGKSLMTTGRLVYWGDVFPEQGPTTEGKYLYSNGSTISWQDASSQAIKKIVGTRVGLTFTSRVDDINTVDVDGLLQIDSGGTGASNAAGALLALLPNQEEQSGKLLGTINGVAQWVSSGAGSVTSVNIDGGSTGLVFSGGPITSSGEFLVGGVLDINNGGTGASTASSALRALLPDQTESAGMFLMTNGSHAFWSPTGSGTVTSVEVSGGNTGLVFEGGPITSSGSVIMGGILSVSNGGTGVSSLFSLQRAILPDQTNNGGMFLTTNGTTTSWAPGGSVYSVQVSGGPTGLTFSGGPITSSGTLTMGGTLAVANGGTGGSNAKTARTNILPAQSSFAGFILSTDGTDVSWVNPATVMNYAAGSNSQVQFNNNGSLGASANLTWNNTTSTLTASNISGAGTNITLLNASNLSSGTVPVARLGTGTPSATTVLKGNGAWTSMFDPKYDLALSITGKPAAGAYVLSFCVVNAFSLPAGLTGSVAKSNSAAAATATFTIYKNGTTIGTIAFAAASTTGAFTFSAAQTFTSGDFIQITAPATQDTSLANIGFTLKGTLTA